MYVSGLSGPTPGPPVDIAAMNGWWTRRLLWIALAFASLLPFLLSPLPPVADLLSHIGRYHIMAFRDQSEFLQRYYSFHWTLIGNLGQDLLVYPLVPLLGAEKAGFLMTALIAPATVLGIRQLSIAAHGEVQPSALLALPFAYSFPFLFGFVNYVTGLALCLWVVAAWYRWRDYPGLVRTVIFVALASLVWLVHMAAWAVLIVATGCIELAYMHKALGWRPVKIAWQAFVRVLPMIAVPVALTLAWRDGVAGENDLDFSQYWLKPYWAGFILRDQSMLLDLASLALLVLAGVFLRVRRNRVETGLGLAAVMLLILFLVMPPNVLNSYFADLRLLTPLAIFALTAMGVNRLNHRQKSFLAAAAVILFSVRLGVITAGWMDRSRHLTEDLKALEHVERGARIAVLSPTRMFESWNNTGLSHVASLAIVRRDAFVNTEWDIPGSQLMHPVYNAGQDFNSDKSAKLQMKKGKEGRTIENMIANLPRSRFDYVWLFKTDVPQGQRPGFEEKFRNGESVLYAIKPAVPANR